ncbi:NAD(P)H-dependent oxidoreductase [Mycobacterium sp. 21AC1]|uniref:NAD(P)H-dependent oxidoreductase n=1 Tax=[Mycobacterium] appelbergii TaxID=2939269 RepID=UPI002939549D|nr:NAD(P)H-dependent oxidoreductase [Mycobacterium sp. 21AC1]MDV3129912.1 NAD(P)H-dependent oxidoreductase [Mycobacterium sp. 21AC1]
MAYILQLDSSADLSSSTSRLLTDEVVQRWAAAGPDREVRRRDLHTDLLPHLSTNHLHFSDSRRPTDGISPAPEALRLQEELISELSAAAGIVIGAPMYNFSMPSTLKAWLDHVHVIGTTSPSDEGIAPLRAKPVIVVSARATPTGTDPRTDFVLGPLFTILGDFMAMNVHGFVVHTEPPAAPGDFHRPLGLVRDELFASVDSWDGP